MGIAGLFGPVIVVCLGFVGSSNDGWSAALRLVEHGCALGLLLFAVDVEGSTRMLSRALLARRKLILTLVLGG